MARHLEFEKDEALRASMEVFWIQGYRNTSMIDLEKATGLKPGSIYNSFVSKKGLFLQAIDHYVRTIVGTRVETILNQGTPLEGIEAFFRTAYEDMESDQLIGCMLTNTATETGAADPDIQTAVSSGISILEQAFGKRLREAQAVCELGAGKDPDVMALHLTSCFQGFGVIGRLTRDKRKLKTITDSAMASLL